MSVNVFEQDQAEALRKFVNSSNNNSDLSDRTICVLSGKGGVGKTSLVKTLYSALKKAYVIDCDVASPYFWRYKNTFDCAYGYFVQDDETVLLRQVHREVELNRFDNILIDGGTGLNKINKYYIKKASLSILVTDMNEMSILNTCRLLDKIENEKIIAIVGASKEDLRNMKKRINIFAAKYLGGESILVLDGFEEVVDYVVTK